GVPGYSTAENVIQTALEQYDLAPDIAIYYLGWADIRNTHIEGLRDDYSDFHAHSQLRNLHLDRTPLANWSVVLRVFEMGMDRFVYHEGYFPARGQLTSQVDPGALAIYNYTVRTLSALARARGIRAVFVPQALNYSALTAD